MIVSCKKSKSSRTEGRRAGVGDSWGDPFPQPRLFVCPNPITPKQSKKELIWDVCNLCHRYHR
jgi:hypothetical protein